MICDTIETKIKVIFEKELDAFVFRNRLRNLGIDFKDRYYILSTMVEFSDVQDLHLIKMLGIIKQHKNGVWWNYVKNT